MLSPVKFVITFKTSGGDNQGAKTPKGQNNTVTQSTNADIKVFLSTTHKEPGENRFEKVYTNVRNSFIICIAKKIHL